MLALPQDAEGVGVNVTPEFHDEVTAHDGGLFSFIELDPEEHLLSRDVVRHLLRGYGERFPVVMHSTTLSLAGDNDLAPELLAQVRTVAELTGASLYSDHLSLSLAGDVHLPLYMAPTMDDEAVARIADRVHRVRDAVGLPFAFENVGMLVPPALGTMDEPEFLARTLRAADCGLQLNLDSVAISAATVGVDPVGWLARFPLDHVVTITVVPEAAMNPILRERFGAGLDVGMRDLLDLALRRSPARRVVIQRRDGNSLDSMRDDFVAANDLYRRHRA